MKILLVSGIFPPDIGGPATFIPELAEYLYSCGHCVTVLSYRNNINTRQTIDTSGSFRLVLVKRNQNKGIRTIITLWKIFSLSRRSNVVLFNGLFYEHAVARPFLSTPYMYKIVGDPVWEKYRNTSNPDISIEEFQKLKLSWKFNLLRRLLSSGIKHASAVVVPGSDLKEVVHGWTHESEITQINNGVPSSLIGGVTKSHDVVSVSRLVNWKNIDLLIEACGIARLSLLIIGDGPEREKLERIAKKFNVQVDFMGEQSQEKVRTLLHKAEIYALISNYEGMAFSLLEAMMQEKKILVSDIKANTNVIQNYLNGMVVTSNKPAIIAEKLEELLKYNASDLAKSARESALNNFALETILVDYSVLIEKHANA